MCEWEGAPCLCKYDIECLYVCFKLDKTKKMCKCLCKGKIEWWGVVFGACGRIWLRFTAGQMLFWHSATLAHNTGTNQSVRVKEYAFHEQNWIKSWQRRETICRLDKIWKTMRQRYDTHWFCCRVTHQAGTLCSDERTHCSNHQPNSSGTECYPNTTLPKTHTISSVANACWRCCRWVT